jgi:CRISPR-associated protein Cas2
MTVVVTRDVEDRYRGFLSSCMLEVSPGCYVGPGMSKGVRDRIWTVLEDWYVSLRRGSLTVLWPDTSAPGGLGMRLLGEPPKDIVDLDGMVLTKWDLPSSG